MKLSVITVNLNGNRYLKEAIASVLMQHSIELEYLIIDGGSADGSLETIAEAASGDNRIKWISEPDRGISDAMNKGISLATGEIIGMLHSDDCYIGKDILSDVVAEFAAKTDAIWATGGCRLMDEDGIPLREVKVRRYSFMRLLRSNIILHPATFVRRSGFAKAGCFNPSLKYAMDYDLWLRLGSLSDPVLINKTVSCHRVHSGGVSSAYFEHAFAEEFQIRIDFLKSKGKPLMFHRLMYLIKNPLNRLYYDRLIGSQRRIS